MAKPNVINAVPMPSSSPVDEPVAGRPASTLSSMAVGPAGGGSVVAEGSVVLVGAAVLVGSTVSLGPAGGGSVGAGVTGGLESVWVDAVAGSVGAGAVVTGCVGAGAVAGGAVVDAVADGSGRTGSVVGAVVGGEVVVTSGSHSIDTLKPPLEMPSGPNRTASSIVAPTVSTSPAW